MSSLPSKTFNIMASARPVLAVCPRESEFGRLVEEADCGVAVDINAFDQLAASILRLRADQNRLEQMGVNGRAVLERKYSRVRCVGMIERLLRRVRNTQRDAAWMAI